MSNFYSENQKKALISGGVVVKDEDAYVGDEVVIERLNSIIQGIKKNVYDEETKQAIYYYGEYYDQIGEPSDYMNQVNEMVKNYVTGWWIHSLIEKSDSVEEKLIEQSRDIESKQ